MGTGRLEAFTDGVIAIVITIMVLDMKVPQGSGFAALRAGTPILLAYVLSYVNVGIIWNNHHHMLHATERVDGKVLWANLFLLFWISLMPFTIRWMDEAHFSGLPTAAYGVTLMMVSLGYALSMAVHSEATLKYINEYRSYLTAYTLGRDMVADAVDDQPGRPAAARWQRFEQEIEITAPLPAARHEAEEALLLSQITGYSK